MHASACLEDEGVEDGVFHGADVEVEHLEVERLEQGDHPGGLAGRAAGERAQQDVGAGDPGLHVGRGGVAAGGELLDRRQQGLAGQQYRRGRAAAGGGGAAAGGGGEGDVSCSGQGGW